MRQIPDDRALQLAEVLLSYRDPTEAPEIARRLEAAEVTAEELLAALRSLGDSLMGADPDDTPTAIHDALLAAEVQAYTSAAYRRAAAVRAHVLGSALQENTLAAVAAELGVSRQAVFKIVKNKESPTAFPQRLRLSEEHTGA